jgi:hypothetical protein
MSVLRCHERPLATQLPLLVVSLAAKLERGYAALLALELNQRLNDMGIVCAGGGASPAPGVRQGKRVSDLVGTICLARGASFSS